MHIYSDRSTNKSRTLNPASVPCPQCHAVIGAACGYAWTAEGHTQQHHLVRKIAAKRAVSK